MKASTRSIAARGLAEVHDVPFNQGDAELVARAQSGESWAEEAIFRRHAPLVLKTAMRLLGDKGEAEDVVQETFVLALESLQKLRDGAALGGWLKQIAVSRAHRRFRRQRMLRWLRIGTGKDSSEHDQVPSTIALDPHAELAWLYRCLEQLPADERIAWTLRNLEGLDLGAIAEMGDCSLATAKRRLTRAQVHVDRHLLGGAQ